MARLAAILMCAAGLSACSEVQTAVDSTARTASKGVVTETLATRFPQVPKELITPFTDCIIDNSSAAEIRDYAKAAVVGVDETTAATIRGVLLRSETQKCITQAGVAALGA